MFFINNSKRVWILYLWLAFIGSIFSLSIFMRLELSNPFSILIDDLCFIYLTSHGFIMLFFFLTIFSSVFLNFLVPDFCFLEDMIFRKANLFGFYFIFISFIFFVLSLFSGKEFCFYYRNFLGNSIVYLYSNNDFKNEDKIGESSLSYQDVGYGNRLRKLLCENKEVERNSSSEDLRKIISNLDSEILTGNWKITDIKGIESKIRHLRKILNKKLREEGLLDKKYELVKVDNNKLICDSYVNLGLRIKEILRSRDWALLEEKYIYNNFIDIPRSLNVWDCISFEDKKLSSRSFFLGNSYLLYSCFLNEVINVFNLNPFHSYFDSLVLEWVFIVVYFKINSMKSHYSYSFLKFMNIPYFLDMSSLLSGNSVPFFEKRSILYGNIRKLLEDIKGPKKFLDQELKFYCNDFFFKEKDRDPDGPYCFLVLWAVNVSLLILEEFLSLEVESLKALSKEDRVFRIRVMTSYIFGISILFLVQSYFILLENETQRKEILNFVNLKRNIEEDWNILFTFKKKNSPEDYSLSPFNYCLERNRKESISLSKNTIKKVVLSDFRYVRFFEGKLSRNGLTNKIVYSMNVNSFFFRFRTVFRSSFLFTFLPYRYYGERRFKKDFFLDIEKYGNVPYVSKVAVSKVSFGKSKKINK